MAKITEEILEIFANCLSAVESGGQIYGNGDWSNVTLQYINSPEEHAITIGAYQRMGVEARADLMRIRKDYPDVFRRHDNAGISNDLDASGWSRYQLPSQGCSKARAIAAIIGSAEGIRTQKKTLGEDVQKYADWIEEKYDVSRIDALLHLVNVRHLGGTDPLERIIGRISGEVTLEKVRDSLLRDGIRYQVGAEPYRTRQALMYKWLHEKISPLLDENGLVSGGDGKKGESAVINGQAACDLALSRLGKNQYTQSSKRTQVFSGYSDCSSLCWKCFERAYGIYIGSWTGEQVTKGRQIIRRSSAAAYAKIKQQELDIMQPGDLIFYGAGDAYHVEMYLGDGKQIGHGSGIGPTIKNCLEYGHSHGFYQVRRYVADDKQSGNTTPAAWKATGTGTSTGDSVNVRLTPGGAILRTVDKGNRFELDGTVVNGWVHVKVESTVGYIHEDYVAVDAPENNPDDYRLFRGKVTASALNVRSWYGCGADGAYYPKIKSYPVLPYGEVVDVLVSYKYGGDTWYKIKIANKYIGFVHGRWIRKI